ncbi:hypothetical protein BV898_04821 [Hypsibius exemplaris]|uniref:Uncharacterized protein n=1 Tax=Hypsibius exemplaris TaxID=2072580 RepID=A0A1W0X1Q2_HYPEX|nr:hypothetical protein BV898_04821 [Hypsibius exemplaris]
MTFLHEFVRYVMKLWHGFAEAVHLEEKKGTQGFWHRINMALVAIPIGGILLVLGLVVLFAAIMMTVPIAKMFGFDLAARFASIQARCWTSFVLPRGSPVYNTMHSNRQKWTSVTPAEGVWKDVVKSVNALAKKEGGEAVEVLDVNHKNMSVKLHVFSPKMKYMDIVEIKVQADPEEMGGTAVDVYSTSAGKAPLSLPPPFGLLMSMALFWLPYSDNGSNKNRLDSIRSSLRDVSLAPSAIKGKSD